MVVRFFLEQKGAMLRANYALLRKFPQSGEYIYNFIISMLRRRRERECRIKYRSRDVLAGRSGVRRGGIVLA